MKSEDEQEPLGGKIKRSKPIHQAIAEVLGAEKRPLTPEEIYNSILERKLYLFRARDPLHVVHTDLKRHCIDLNFPSARATKYFKRELSQDGPKYCLLDKPVQVEPNVYKVKQPGKHGHETIVTVVPEEEDVISSDGTEHGHTEIQWKLLDLGSKMGMSVWAPIADRNKRWERKRVGDVARLRPSLPRQFDHATMRIISYIDVIWLEKEAIIAAFEVEHTSPVYSGLLRMADLMTMQPNLQINWFLVAPEQRFDKFAIEVARPTFCGLRQPLYKVCRFLPYKRLIQRLDAAQEFLSHLKPGFLEDISEQYNPAEAFRD